MQIILKNQQLEIMQYQIFCGCGWWWCPSNDCVPRGGRATHANMVKPNKETDSPLSPPWECPLSHLHLHQLSLGDVIAVESEKFKHLLLIFYSYFNIMPFSDGQQHFLLTLKTLFLPQTRPNVKTILFWLARNNFLPTRDDQTGFHPVWEIM